MENLPKKEAMNQWLESKPGKTERDWLLEVKCATDIQKQSLKELLECCDACGMTYEICHEVDLDKVYADIIASDSYLKEFLDYKGMETFNNFAGYRNVVFEDASIKYNQCHVFDLYFPNIGWYINIGTEIEDATTDSWIQQTGPTYFKRTGTVWNSIARTFMKKFHEKLNAQYSIPKSDRFRNEYEGCYYAFLPWNKDVEANAKESDLKDYELLPGSVGRFWATLFKDNFQEMKSFRKDTYLKRHPDVKEKRAAMLHSLVTEVKNGLGPNKTVSSTQINKLLETVDNELSVHYPEYEKIHHMLQWSI